MQFSVPYVYLGISSKTEQTSTAEVYGGWETIEIPTISEDEAPVVARSIIGTREGLSSVTELRQLDGHCYRLKRVVPPGDYYRSEMPPVQPDDLGMIAPFVASSFGFSKEFEITVDGSQSGLMHDSIEYVLEVAGRQPEATELMRSNQQIVLRQIQETASGLFVLGDQIWERCSAPVLSMLIGKNPPVFDLHFIDIPKDPNCLETVVPLTGMDHLRLAALSFCEEPMAWGVNPGKANWSVKFDDIVFPTVEVFDPSALPLPLPILERNIIDQLQRIPHPGTKTLDHMDDEYIDAWQALRRLSNYTCSDQDETLQVELVEALSSLALMRIDRLSKNNSPFAYQYRLATDKLEIGALQHHLSLFRANAINAIAETTLGLGNSR